MFVNSGKHYASNILDSLTFRDIEHTQTRTLPAQYLACHNLKYKVKAHYKHYSLHKALI